MSTGTIGRRFAAVFAAALLIGAAGGEKPPPEPDDYRMDDYRAPTPDTLRGATVLTTEQARAIWQRHDAVFIDVLDNDFFGEPQTRQSLG